MAPPPRSQIPPAAKPKFGNVFDAWNSSSTGHQRAEKKAGGSTGWRMSRTAKLACQLKSGDGGGRRMADLVGVGAGAKDYDEKEEERQAKKVGRKIFDGLVIYINGSTHPLISDHRLKHVWAENGGKVSIHLGRKVVTHVVLGTPNGNGAGAGAGGGLAAGKMQREIAKVRGKGIKYVGVEWVLESLKAGKRLPEASFSNLSVAPKGQSSVFSMLKKTSSPDSQATDT